MSISEYRIDHLYKGLVESFEFIITDRMMNDFSKISGDYNPLHNNVEYAKSKGFDGVVVYGGLLISQISQIIGMHLPGNNSIWNGLNVSFVNPLKVNQKAVIVATIVHISKATSSFKFNIRILHDEIVILKGSADITIL